MVRGIGKPGIRRALIIPIVTMATQGCGTRPLSSSSPPMPLDGAADSSMNMTYPSDASDEANTVSDVFVAAGNTFAEASDAACTCPSISSTGTCPCACVAWRPQLYDRALGCIYPPADLAICTTDGCEAATGCWARMDTGDLYYLDCMPASALLASGTVWRQCTASESAQVLNNGVGPPPCGAE
jgi:hypothetical protein